MSFYLWQNNPLESREDLEKAHNELFEPLVPAFSPSGARVRISHFGSTCSEAAAELEGFSRPLWGIVAYVYGGGSFQHWDLYSRGLVNGCNPNHPDYWGNPGDFDQILVDIAAIAYALCFCKQQLWDPIDSEGQAAVIAYLKVVREREFCHNNWKFFRVLIDLALEKIGVQLEKESTEKLLDDLESLYLGGGWYGDGKPHRIDYYNGFAFHFYSLVYVWVQKDNPKAKERCKRFLDRTTEFARDYIHWFAEDGASLPYGRSLNYKFGVVGFWGLYAAVIDQKKEPFVPWGVLKGLYMRHFQWWSTQPVLQRDSGVLTLGYSYPNVLMTERYNSPQSPYWATKCFAGLFLPASHPFWTSSIQPLVLPDRYVPTIGMHFSHFSKNTVAIINGPWNDEYQPEKYSKFAYSTRYGFGVITNHRTFPLAHVDNMLAFSFDNRTFHVRENYKAYISDNGAMVSEWTPFPGINVTTTIVVGEGYHSRMHQIENNTEFPVLTREGGFAINNHHAEKQIGGGKALVETPSDYSCIYDTMGIRKPEVGVPEPNGNVTFARVLIPQLTGKIDAKCNVTYGCQVYANSQTVNPPSLMPIPLAQPCSKLFPVLCNQ